jgi:hypothetical protein
VKVVREPNAVVVTICVLTKGYSSTMKWLVLLFALICPLAADAELSGLRHSRRRDQQGTTPAARVVKLRLINADTDQPIAGYDPLWTEDYIELDNLPNNLNIEAITQGNVGSVRWSYSSLSRPARIDNSARWSFCGNQGPDFFPCSRSTLPLGLNDVWVIELYSGKDATGDLLSSQSFIIRTISGKRHPLTLINSKTDQDIGPLLTGTVIDLAKTPKLNVRVDTNVTNVALVQFQDNWVHARDEYAAPYALGGNNGSDYYDWTPTVGEHVISTYVSVPGGHTASTNFVRFTVVDSAPKVPTPAPTPAPIWALPPSYDSTPPRLLNFTNLSPVPVNISIRAVITKMRVVAQDNETGLEDAYVTAVRTVLGQGTTSIYSSQAGYWAAAVGKPGIRDVGLMFPTNVGNGNYQLAVSVRDKNYQLSKSGPADLARRGFPSQLTVVGGTNNPLLLNFTASYRKPTVAFTAIVKSDGFKYSILETESKTTYSFRTLDCTTDSTVKGGRCVFFLMIEEIPTDTYTMRLVLEYEGSNAPYSTTFNTIYNSTDLQAAGFPYSMTIAV